MKKLIFLLVILLMAAGPTVMAQDTTYQEMVGTYKFPAGNIIPEAIVKIENGGLTMTSSQGASPLEKVKGDTFNVVNFAGICVFIRNDAKKITGVHVDASGYVMDGVKEPAMIKLNAADESNQTVIPTELIENVIGGMRSFFRPKIIGCITEKKLLL